MAGSAFNRKWPPSTDHSRCASLRPAAAVVFVRCSFFRHVAQHRCRVVRVCVCVCECVVWFSYVSATWSKSAHDAARPGSAMYLVQVNQSLKCFGRRSVGFDTFGRVHQIFRPGRFRCNVAGFDQNWMGFRGFLVDFSSPGSFRCMLPGLTRTGWVFVGFQWIFLVLAVFVAMLPGLIRTGWVFVGF